MKDEIKNNSEQEKTNNTSINEEIDKSINKEKQKANKLTGNNIHDLVYEIVRSHIDNVLYNDGGDGIVRFKCLNCDDENVYPDNCGCKEAESYNDIDP